MRRLLFFFCFLFFFHQNLIAQAPSSAQAGGDTPNILPSFPPAESRNFPPSESTVGDFMDLHMSNSPRFFHYLGLTFQGGYGVRGNPIGTAASHIQAGAYFSYLILLRGSLPYVGLGFSVGVDMVALPNFSLGGIDRWGCIPTMTPLVQIYLASPVYLGFGAKLGIQSSFWGKDPFNVGALVKLGWLQSFDGFSLDIGLEWNYFPSRTDLGELYAQKTHRNPTYSQSINFSLGFFGLIG